MCSRKGLTEKLIKMIVVVIATQVETGNRQSKGEAVLPQEKETVPKIDVDHAIDHETDEIEGITNFNSLYLKIISYERFITYIIFSCVNEFYVKKILACYGVVIGKKPYLR